MEASRTLHDQVEVSTSRATPSETWKAAQWRASALDRVLDGISPRATLIARAAAELNLTTRQIYYLLKRYTPKRTVSSLLPLRPTTRVKRLSASVEHIIAEVLRDQWLILEAPPLNPAVKEIRSRCLAAGEKPPCYRAVQNRIPILFDPQTIARKRSASEKHVHRLQPRPGRIVAQQPLAVCQMDHTPSDIAFVEVIGHLGSYCARAYLTIIVDVFSRAILGFCLTLEKPSALSIALCMAHALCSKADWLTAHNLGPHDWPFGRPHKVVVDKAREFKSHAFIRGCDEYRIKIRRRNRGTVHQGGVVERILGKLNRILATLPGRTGSSIADRDGYPSEKRARLTFNELEQCVALAILEHNIDQNEKTLIVPALEWAKHAAGLPHHNDDPVQVLINFLPGGYRCLTPQGVHIHALDYYSPWLGQFVPERDRIGKLEVRYDPRDINYVYVRNPRTKSFLAVARRDGQTMPVTLWEHQQDRREKRARARPLEQQRVMLQRQRVQIAAEAFDRSKGKTNRVKKKGLLRAAARSKHAAAASKPYEAVKPDDPPLPTRQERGKRILPIEDW
ncbi:Mu transposase C-terminal domain-containing protein [Microvirga sp. TS319]|uniref:Mu transposase C-terminal domain-containing protein n=1 Tax=Microvirga sp. TS319 TaxID=3241165 RepID=UPI00351A10AD